MTNEEIREAIQQQQQKIQEILITSSNTFELNPEILKHKKAIDALRTKCTHLNTNHEAQTFNGRCVYCGKAMG
jgi:DNA-binding protein H-NS